MILRTSRRHRLQVAKTQGGSRMTSAENDAVLDRFVDKAGRLYTLPAVAVEVLQLTDRPDVDVEQLRRAIENDPALTSRVLRVVNSSLFGLSREVSDLKRAWLSWAPSRSNCWSSASACRTIYSSARRGTSCGATGGERSPKPSRPARSARRCGNFPATRRSLRGCCKTWGCSSSCKNMASRTCDCSTPPSPRPVTSEALAAKAIGFDHAHLTARLLEKWGLPKNLVEAISAGRPPETIAELPPQARCLPQILHLAELLAGLLTENRTDLLPDLLEAAERYHALRRSELSGLVGTLQTKVEQLADVLNLELGNGTDYTAVMLKAHERLSDVAADVAGDLIRPRQPVDEVKESESLLAEVQALQAAAKQAARSGSRVSSQPSGKDTTLRSKLWAEGHAPHSQSASQQPIGRKTEPVVPRARRRCRPARSIRHFSAR